MKLLENTVAIVTGGAQGLDAAHVCKLIEEGAKVVINDFLIDKGEKFAK